MAEAYQRKGIETEVLAGEKLIRRRLSSWSENGTLSRFSCIHLATHGISVLGEDVSDTPMESRILLFDAALDGLEISHLCLKADLVVLSACNSGQRAIGGRDMDELPGDDVFGLQAAFAMAGAQAVLGCLWPADDGSAKAIMVSFHQYRSQQQPADVALQLAIVDHLRQAESRHCYLWAPFFLSILGARTDTRERINQNMPDLTLYFDCDPGTDPENLERDLQQGLQQLGNVKAAETSTPAIRITGLEILAAITLAVHVVHEARSIVEDLKVLFGAVADLAGKLQVRQVRVPVGLEKKPIGDLTDEDYQRIATKVAKLLQANSDSS